MKRKFNKSDKIRDLLEEGKLTPNEIADEAGCHVSQVYGVRSRMKGASPTTIKKQIAKKDSQTGITIDKLRRAKDFIDDSGGLEQAKGILDVVGDLVS